MHTIVGGPSCEELTRNRGLGDSWITSLTEVASVVATSFTIHTKTGGDTFFAPERLFLMYQSR